MLLEASVFTNALKGRSESQSIRNERIAIKIPKIHTETNFDVARLLDTLMVSRRYQRAMAFYASI